MAKTGDRNDDHYNSHGYRDPTAYAAMRNLSAEEQRFKKLIRTIFALCDIAGFTLTGRITLTDKRTGRIWE